MKAFLFLLSFSMMAMAAGPKVERKLYVGKDSVEATMTFRGQVEMASTRKPTENQALEKVEAQINHFFGPMGEARQKAVPKGDHEVDVLSITAKAGTRAGWVVSYTYEGTIVVALVAGKLPGTYAIVMPINPDTIYKESKVGNKYPCTDDHYQSEGDFWYFWNPKKPGCKLKENVHYVKLDAKVAGRPNTRITYPKYSDLLDSNNVIDVSLLMGMDDPDKNDHNPLESADINARNYVAIANGFESRGYSRRQWSEAEIKAVSPRGGNAFVEEFEKKLQKATIRIRLFFGPSGINEESSAFHYFFKNALEKAAIMMYDGHSGLGGHLDLASIEQTEGFRITPPKDRYQIYFFNSCSSYSYYNTMFFGRKATASDKRGIKNLEILTNGLATYFSVMHDTNMEMVSAIEAWSAAKGSVSYQAVASKIDSGNLFGVNGDEDNPTKP